jgi:hypothetical protein
MFSHKADKTIANVRVGKAKTEPAAPAHTRGVRAGNRRRGSLDGQKGIEPTGPWSARGTAERSTGINAKARNPIDPRSPNLSPS